jgi:hypothetical protein
VTLRRPRRSGAGLLADQTGGQHHRLGTPFQAGLAIRLEAWFFTVLSAGTSSWRSRRHVRGRTHRGRGRRRRLAGAPERLIASSRPRGRLSMRPPATRSATGSPERVTGRSTGFCTSWPPSSYATRPKAAPTSTARKPPGKPRWKPCGALKRRLSDVVYRQMINDAAAPMATGPGGHRGTSTNSSVTSSHPHAGSLARRGISGGVGTRRHSCLDTTSATAPQRSPCKPAWTSRSSPSSSATRPRR